MECGVFHNRRRPLHTPRAAMIYVLAAINVKPGCRERFLSEFRRIVEAVRAEDGCIEYVPTIDLPTSIAAQPEIREDVVMVVEKWESTAHLEAHLIAPHMLEYRQRVKELVLSASLQIVEPAGD